MFKRNAYFILCFYLCLKHKWALFSHFLIFFFFNVDQLNHNEVNRSETQVYLEHAQFTWNFMLNDFFNRKGELKYLEWILNRNHSSDIWVILFQAEFELAKYVNNLILITV